ncbi:hypothetical protein NE237_021389 [Protea cynaroides]|uniref:Uncharacterized protein n=1 Tax=Protea cynaroides TaxID=273540 RepID=A0A9Q0HD59_9MAGN|nr:hypothetical protein NE237_021389 [Protea cynaroides]
MVAISLYRGNLHRVPDVPRRWLTPAPRISLKDFRSLIRKRTKALSRLSAATGFVVDATTSSDAIPNPNPSPSPIHCSNPDSKQQEGVGDSSCSKQNHQSTETAQPQSHPTVVNCSDEPPSVEHARDQNGTDGDSRTEQTKVASDSIPFPARKSTVPDAPACTSKASQEKKPVSSAQLTVEVNGLDAVSDKERRKSELQEKLQILTEKKHNLVQMLKQIQNAEEEMKKRNSIQASIARPSGPLQVEATAELGSVIRHATPRMSSEANFGGDLEGEAEDISNHSTQSRHLHRMRSTSPSGASPLRRPLYSPLQHNPVLHNSRSSISVTGHTQPSTAPSMGVTASPSRFAPTGHQSHSANLPTVSVSGTHYVASSPSPAGSGALISLGSPSTSRPPRKEVGTKGSSLTAPARRGESKTRLLYADQLKKRKKWQLPEQTPSPQAGEVKRKLCRRQRTSLPLLEEEKNKMEKKVYLFLIVGIFFWFVVSICRGGRRRSDKEASAVVVEATAVTTTVGGVEKDKKSYLSHYPVY